MCTQPHNQQPRSLKNPETVHSTYTHDARHARVRLRSVPRHEMTRGSVSPGGRAGIPGRRSRRGSTLPPAVSRSRSCHRTSPPVAVNQRAPRGNDDTSSKYTARQKSYHNVFMENKIRTTMSIERINTSASYYMYITQCASVIVDPELLDYNCFHGKGKCYDAGDFHGNCYGI